MRNEDDRGQRSWDAHFLSIAKQVSQKSKDPSTKVGAVIVGPMKEIRSTGFNGFPRGIEDTSKRYSDRRVKYPLVIHGEMNAIYNATLIGARTQRTTIYVTHPTCLDCAKGIIQTGIYRVVVSKEGSPLVEREPWKTSWEKATAVYEEAGVEYETNVGPLEKEDLELPPGSVIDHLYSLLIRECEETVEPVQTDEQALEMLNKTIEGLGG